MHNEYKSEKVIIKKIEDQAPNVKLFRFAKAKGKFNERYDALTFKPGQFYLASIMGYGEAPFGAASSPFEDSHIDLLVRRAGTFTDELHKKKVGDTIFLRGPYGNGFPIDFMEQKDIVMVTGGCGIPPIAALIEYIIKRRRLYGSTYLIYGAKTPNDLLMLKNIARWKEDINVLLTVDQPDSKWQGHVGLVSNLLREIKINPTNTVAAMCGPGPMMDAVENILRPLGISDRRIYVNMERKMQCGIGKCQHCAVGNKYVCKDGPVFNFDEIDKSWDN
jgi:NAD(P)H-flavin reductase